MESSEFLRLKALVDELYDEVAERRRKSPQDPYAGGLQQAASLMAMGLRELVEGERYGADVSTEGPILRWDSERDVLLVWLLPGREAQESRDIERDVFVDFDEAGALIAVEILSASRYYPLSMLKKLTMTTSTPRGARATQS
ncbi:MAG TPA: DUF2283 domain-containing protein [Gemmatimonadales bacterium]|nr:DUF2283 domain-containing protein [Gemmatimonadales bacterium]